MIRSVPRLVSVLRWSTVVGLVSVVSTTLTLPGQQRVDIRGVSFQGTNLRFANLAAADLTGCSFQNAKLGGANLWRARLDDVDLRGATGLTIQMLSSAIWDPQRPPKLSVALNAFRRYLEKKRLDRQALGGVVWWGADLRGFDLTHADLRRAVLIGADLRGAILLDAKLGEALLAGANVSGADLRSASGLSAGQLVSTRWDPKNPPKIGPELGAVIAQWQKKRLVNTSLRGARLWLRDLRGFNLNGVDLSKAALMGADLTGATLHDANLTGAVFTGADLSGTDLRGTKGLTAAQLMSARWQVRRPPLVSVALNVLRVRLDKRRLELTNLSGANFWGGDFKGCNFLETDLRGVVFVDANLQGAKLQRANLSGAALAGARISGADLRGVLGLTVGQLYSARWDPDSPPRLPRDLDTARVRWDKLDLRNGEVIGACIWDAKLRDARFQGAKFTTVTFVRGDLSGASFARGDLSGTRFFDTDISGVDFRGARSLTAKMFLSAVWDPKRPPMFDSRFNALRILTERRRFEFDLQGAYLNGPDPKGVMGPVRRRDRIAKWGEKKVPRFGMQRLIRLLRKREYGQMLLIR